MKAHAEQLATHVTALEAARQSHTTLSETTLSARLQLATLDAGALRPPPGATHALLEIGCSDRDTLDDAWLSHDPSGFLVAFEPLLDKYAVLLARGTARYHQQQKDMAVPLGHHHPRGVVLPLAVSTDGGRVDDFKVSSVAGCSSMLEVNQTTQWGQWCVETLERREVPSISLTAAIGLVGELPIRLLKIDVQGLDFALVRSVAPALLRAKVRAIVMEVIASDGEPLYHGQPQCAEVVQYMRAIGFGRTAYLPGNRCSGWRWPESDVVFYRDDVPHDEVRITGHTVLPAVGYPVTNTAVRCTSAACHRRVQALAGVSPAT